MPLSILTLNIWNDDGPWKERAERIRDWIELLDPDLIGLQEVLVGPGTDQARELIADRGYSLDFAPAVRFWRNPDLEFGNAIASRWPHTDREHVALPDAGDGETRVALSVTVEGPSGPLCFTCTHLNWRLHHGWARERQVVALGELVLRRRAKDGFPPILVGDMNAEPDSSEMRYVRGLQALDGRSLHLRDAWLQAGSGSDGITWANRNVYAAPALEPDRRIDYVYVGPPQRNGMGRVESCRVVMDDARDGVWPSDHFGVYAELRTEPL